MYDFHFSKARSIDEAVDLKKFEDTEFLAGGQTLIPTLKQRMANPTRLVSIIDIPGIKGITARGKKKISIGAATTHEEVFREAIVFQGLSDLAGRIGDPAVRNRGTIGGSIANNDPSACYPAAALASGAHIVTNLREILADDFFKGMFETALKMDEIITEIKFPIPLKANYQKFEQPASRFALVGVFLAVFDKSVRVAVTGASVNGVFRWFEAEKVLKRNFVPEMLDALTFSNQDEFIDDMHGTAEYRSNLIKVLTKRAVLVCENQSN